MRSGRDISGGALRSDVELPIVLSGDQVARGEPAVRTAEVGDVHLHMVAVVVWPGPIGLAEQKVLVAARLHGCNLAVAIPEFGACP